jgi:photosystem II stability/assembly factor-like uncharacterized protein
MKKLILIFLITNCSVLITNCLSQWVQQYALGTSLLDCDFINQNTGWACGDGGVIVKTTNGGLNWIQQNSGVLKRLEGIDAVDANTLFCVGWFQTILKSIDGGNNWLIIRDGPTGTGSTFFKTFFLNANTGWLLRSGGGFVLRTSNGGVSFDSTFTNNSFNRDIYFKDANMGVLCGDGAWIMKSTDGGITWNQIILPLGFESPNLYRMSFVNNYGWTIGHSTNLNNLGPQVFKTTDFGSSWDTVGRVLYPNNEENYSVFFSSLNTGYCGGTTGYSFKTINGGFNWYQQVTPVTGFRNDFWFYNDSIGWVVGGGGRILHTTTGGQYVGVQNLYTELPHEHNLKNIFPNPFNPLTTITIEIAYNDHVKIIIYDMLGREVQVLLNKRMNAGTYKINFDASKLSSGVYICNLQTSKIQKSKTMILIK